jgi:hypothetical protein
MMHWRLFEVKDGHLHTLFHAVTLPSGRRSRRIPEGVWLEAGARLVADGCNLTWYPEGFHVFADPRGLDYLARFRKPRVLVAVLVEVEGLRPKPTNPGVLLAARMRVPVGAGRMILRTSSGMA